MQPDESMEDRLRRMEDLSIEDRLRRREEESEVELLRRENAELRMKLKAAGANTPRYITPHTLEEELKEVSSHVILSKGKYVVNFDIIINENGMLEIEPGVELYFSKDAGIVAYGKLYAVGTEGNPIVFDTAAQSWRNIAFAGGIASDSVLEHCIIRRGDGRKGIKTRGHFDGFRYNVNVGGGLLVVSADPTIKHCRIENNSASSGGGLYLHYSNPHLEGNTISGNRAGSNGGGLYLNYSNPHLEGNTISDNRAGHSGGGFCFHYSNPHLESNIISGNHAEFDGGGFSLSRSNPHLTSNTISGNHADNHGGGLCLYSSDPHLEGNTISGNRAEYSGGGLGLWSSDPHLEGNTISGNHADWDGGGLYLFKSSPRLEGNTIKDNKPDDIR